MEHRGRRVTLFAEIKKQIEERLGGPLGDLKSAQESLAYLSWLAWHCRGFASVPSFLDAARSDIVAILYAGAVGMERSAYLHSRSLLENLVRHCYYDSRPALFTARHLADEESVHDQWKELFEAIQRLPHFRPTWETLDAGGDKGDVAVLGRSALFATLRDTYAGASRYVHGSTVRYRSAYEGVISIGLDVERARDLGDFLQGLSEASLLLLAMLHLGPYLLISQPIRRYMLANMRGDARKRFLRCMAQVSYPWAQHQRAAALRVSHERRHAPVQTADGILLTEEGSVLVVRPVA